MDKIASFSKNHDELKQGLHLCGTAHGVTTWDLRFKKPNGGDYLNIAAMHTIEHLIATIVRNSKHKDDIIYFGPMGCRTGFYLLTVNLGYDEVKKLLTDSLALAQTFDEVPGNKCEECGNYLEHDLQGAKAECANYLKILENI
ncbi:MAG: S-ribosylhomocysteine lyase [Clostridia bacterium]|nr:S-ribosylhomocysteine lyase [Clostridia bacterium]